MIQDLESADMNQRRLSAIVAADVAGYSRLMGLDEAGTLTALKACQREVIEPTVKEHGGRLVKTTGDGFLIEFASIISAIACSLEIQNEVLSRGASDPPDRRLLLRIGINLGDVLVEGGDIFGTGVNVAARLEGIADPGTICVSAPVREQIASQMTVAFRDLGMRALKNIEEPIRVYQIIPEVSVDLTLPPEPGRQSVPRPGRPAIAIMAFRNLNGDAENDFIAEGIGLGIQTLMVQLSGLFLMNATSDQAYRRGEIDAREALKGQPVRYALEGAVQHAGPRVRVTVKLTDLDQNEVVWAESFDSDLEQVFTLQDEVTREVISALSKTILGGQLGRIWTRDLAGNGAWEYLLRGLSHFYRFTPDDNRSAREMFEKLYELHSEKGIGAGYVALSHFLDMARHWTDDPKNSMREAAKWAELAMANEKRNDGLGHAVMGSIKLIERDHDAAFELCRKSVSYRANCPFAIGQLAAVQMYRGDSEGAIKSAREAMGVRTVFPPQLINLLAAAYRDAGRTALSIPAAEEAIRVDPGLTDGMVTLLTAHALGGNEDDAKRVGEQILAASPDFSAAAYLQRQPYRDSVHLQRLAGALRAAGLPD
jgi:class 3 adenylate cyclase/TolB-like protein